MTRHIISFRLQDSDDSISVQTDRPDWLNGTAFIGLAPDHALATTIGRKAVNPLNDQPVPLIVDEAIAGDTLLGVPAHDSLSRTIAARHGVAYHPVVSQDFGAPLPDSKDVFGVVVVGYDPQTDKYLGLLNGSQAWLAGGGREADETYEECAKRELHEEAGYDSVTAWIRLGDPIYSYYFNPIKQSSRRSLGYNYMAILDSTSAGIQRQEAHEDFKLWWTSFDELYDSISRTDGGVGHWLEALRRARAAAEAYNSVQAYEPDPYTGEGVLINSGAYDGMDTADARQAIVAELRKRRRL